MTTVTVGVGPVSFADVLAVARDGAAVELHPDAVTAIEQARLTVEKLAAAPTPSYGISTGFGALATRHIPTEMRAQLQKSLVRSHAAGSGPEVEREVTRALMLLRLSTLATGHTGVRPVVAQTMAAMLTHGITPVVHEYGSLGCSGDLAPLSHCALALMGEGEVSDPHGVRRPAAVALAEAGLAPVELEAKEGLALINGTDGMLGMLVLAIEDLRMLLKAADVTAAMSVEGQLATDRVFAADLQALRPHPGQAASAANLVRLLADSEIVASHRGPDCNRVQDAYSLRCSPQVHGAARDTVDHAALVASRELASAVDNPVVLDDGRVESNGNFHGAPVGLRARLPGDRRRRRRVDQRAPHRPVPRPDPQPRAAAVPGPRPRRRLRPHDRAVHPGRDRLGDEAARRTRPASTRSRAARCRRTTSRWAGPRPASCAAPSTGWPGWSRSSTSPRPAPWTCAARSSPRPATAAAVALLRRNVEGPGPDRHLSPEIEHAFDDVRSGALVRAVEDTMGELA